MILININKITIIFLNLLIWVMIKGKEGEFHGMRHINYWGMPRFLVNFLATLSMVLLTGWSLGVVWGGIQWPQLSDQCPQLSDGNVVGATGSGWYSQLTWPHLLPLWSRAFALLPKSL